MNIEKNRIRLLYYVSTLLIIILLVTSLNSMFFKTLNHKADNQNNILKTNTLEMKKQYLRSIVDTTIQHIIFEKEVIATDLKTQLNSNLNSIRNSITNNYQINFIANQLETFRRTNNNTDYILYNNITNRIISSTINEFSDVEIELTSIVDYFVDNKVHIEISSDRYTFTITIPDLYIDSIVKTNMKPKIKKLELPDSGYIWINEIINYQGGDNYAIRLIHPNLPETEGSYLSTYTTDSFGNRPYYYELEGMKTDGELYYEYYFKKKDVERVTRKLSYAKLYKPFNWVIATGIHLDDIDRLIEIESQKFVNSSTTIKRRVIILSLLASLLCIALIVIFESKITQLIVSFQNSLVEKNRSIQKEKDLIEKIAFLDPLTSVLNRRAITNRLETHINHAQRHSDTFTVGILDIDNFKLINDSYGHDAGDHVIMQVCSIIKSNIRMEDAVGRWGGEEFLIILDHSDRDIAETKFNNLINLINRSSIKYNDYNLLITVTIGSYSLIDSTLNMNEIIKKADDNLYKGKSLGKNRVISS